MGLFARSIEDIALLRSVLVGEASQKKGIARGRIRIGVCRTSRWSEAQPETVHALEAAARALSASGADVTDAELPDVFTGIEDSFRVIVKVEGARAMDWETRHHLATMNYWLKEQLGDFRPFADAQYERAQAHSLACQRALAKLFERYDVIITPSACGEAVADLTSVSNSVFNRVWTLMRGPCFSIPASTGRTECPWDYRSWARLVRIPARLSLRAGSRCCSTNQRDIHRRLSAHGTLRLSKLAAYRPDEIQHKGVSPREGRQPCEKSSS